MERKAAAGRRTLKRRCRPPDRVGINSGRRYRSPDALLPAIRQKIRKLDAELGLANLRTMDQWLSNSAAQPGMVEPGVWRYGEQERSANSPGRR